MNSEPERSSPVMSIVVIIAAITLIPFTCFASIFIAYDLSDADLSRNQAATPTATATNTVAAPSFNFTAEAQATETSIAVATNQFAQLAGSAIGTPEPVNNQIPVLATETVEIAPFPVTQACPCDQGDILSCEDFSTQLEAQSCWNSCALSVGGDVHLLDVDGDTLACEDTLFTTISAGIAPGSPALTGTITLPSVIEPGVVDISEGTLTPTAPPIVTSPTPTVCPCSSNVLDCPDFDSPEEAQQCYNRCLRLTNGDVHDIADDNGLACQAPEAPPGPAEAVGGSEVAPAPPPAPPPVPATSTLAPSSSEAEVTSTPVPVQIQPTQVSAPCSCSSDTLNCSQSDFASEADAQACFEFCDAQGAGDVHGLDRDDDRIACENGLN